MAAGRSGGWIERECRGGRGREIALEGVGSEEEGRLYQRERDMRC
jgi:hypothetical protein